MKYFKLHFKSITLFDNSKSLKRKRKLRRLGKTRTISKNLIECTFGDNTVSVSTTKFPNKAQIFLKVKYDFPLNKVKIK